MAFDATVVGFLLLGVDPQGRGEVLESAAQHPHEGLGDVGEAVELDRKSVV